MKRTSTGQRMSQQTGEEPQHAPRAGDRRGNERRRLERRAPPPPWRRPWALVAYGVLGTLAIVLLLNGVGGGDDEAPRDEALVERTSEGATQVAPPNPQAAAAGPEDAYGTAGYERLVVEGEAAVGRVVRAELFCEAPQNFTIVAGHTAPRSVAALIQEGEVPAARCKWGPTGEPRREELLLLVPPAQAEAFAAAPVVSDNFVERRRVVAEMEWVGRSETLALRTAAVFRSMVPS